MLEAISALLLSIILFLINFYISRDIFYPPSLFCLIWIAVLFSYVAFLSNHAGESYLLTLETLIYFLLGQIIFSAGSFFAIDTKNTIKDKFVLEYFLGNFDRWIILFLVLMLPTYINTLNSIVNNSKLDKFNFYIVLRYEFITNGINVGLLDYLNPLSVFAFSLALYRFNFLEGFKKRTFKDNLYKILVYLVTFVYAFLTTGRTYFVMLFSVYIGYKVVAKSFKKIHLVGATLIFLIVFVGNAFILGKGADADASVSENATSIFDNITIYFLGGAYGFNNLIKNGFTYEYGENIFRFFVSVGNALKIIDFAPKDLVMPYVTRPIVTNVYTIYYNYVKDFGFIGIIFIGLWGYIHSFIYYKRKVHFIYLYAYTLLLYPLIMSFFQDQYLSLLSTWIQLFFYGAIASLIIKQKSKLI